MDDECRECEYWNEYYGCCEAVFPCEKEDEKEAE